MKKFFLFITFFLFIMIACAQDRWIQLNSDTIKYHGLKNLTIEQKKSLDSVFIAYVDSIKYYRKNAKKLNSEMKELNSKAPFVKDNLAVDVLRYKYTKYTLRSMKLALERDTKIWNILSPGQRNQYFSYKKGKKLRNVK